MEINIKHFRINVENNEFVHAVYKEGKNSTRGCVVFSHGFGVPGFESHRMFWEISNDLVKNGFSTVLFDYRGSGYSDGSFENMTIETEISDLNAVIDYIKNCSSIFTNKLVLWGQSFGSGVASIVSASRQDIDFTILWCLSADLYNRYKKTLGEKIFTDKYVFLGSGLKVSINFLESLKARDVYRSIASINNPILFVHGTDDEKASVELSKKGYELAHCDKTIFLLDGGNHGFKGQPIIYENAKQKTYKWLLEKLTGD